MLRKHGAKDAASSSKRTNSYLDGNAVKSVTLRHMGRSNRTAALESKIMFLMGEHESKLVEVAKAEKLVEQLPAMRERLWEIETLISACETVIKSDHPDWTRNHLKPIKAFVHKIPVRLGNASKLALDVLRLADEPMIVRNIAIEVLKREGLENPDTDTITKVANTIGRSLAKRRGTVVQSDRRWPARWWVIQAKSRVAASRGNLGSAKIDATLSKPNVNRKKYPICC